METALRFAIMLGLLAAVLYGTVWIRNRKRRKQLSNLEDFRALSTGPFPLWTTVLGIGGAIAAGFFMVTVSFSSPSDQPKKDDTTAASPESFTPVFVMQNDSKAKHRMKLIVFEDPDMVNPLTLGKCADTDVTVVDKLGKVTCEDYDYVTNNPEMNIETWVPKEFHPSLQMMFAPGKASKPPKKRSRVWDRYAEIIYFLALVFGVLAKYYWDYSEAKQRGEQTEFHPNYIILSLIVALLVYFSVQQGIEGEGGTFSFRGFLFAFMNGFTWQTLIKPSGYLRPQQNGETKPDGTPTPS